MSARREQYLERLGITAWALRSPAAEPERVATPAEPVQQPSPEPTAVDAPAQEPPVVDSPAHANTPTFSDWGDLEARVATCTVCELHGTRTQTVFGVGNREAEWMIVGEAPGAEEDRKGEPFVGRAGKLLDNMLRAAGFAREDVFIANILKCRPPNNRDPRPEEAAACGAYLRQQIEWVAPKLILCVGRVASQNLLGTDESTGRLRGRVHRHPETDTPVIVTYHPAYLLRQPSEKRKAWEDLKLAMRVARGELP